MNPLADLTDSIRGWSEIVAGKPEAERNFRLTGVGPVIAAGWLLVAVLLSAAIQSAVMGMPSLGSVTIGLFAQALTVGILGVVIAQTLHFIKSETPFNALLVPALYVLAYMFVLAVPLSLIGGFAGLFGIIAVGALIGQAGRMIAKMPIGVAIAFGAMCVIVLVVVPSALYILFLQIPSPA